MSEIQKTIADMFALMENKRRLNAELIKFQQAVKVNEEALMSHISKVNKFFATLSSEKNLSEQFIYYMDNTYYIVEGNPTVGYTLHPAKAVYRA